MTIKTLSGLNVKRVSLALVCYQGHADRGGGRCTYIHAVSFVGRRGGHCHSGVFI